MNYMNHRELLLQLEDLKANPRPSYEAKSMIDPFRGCVMNLTILFASSVRTFGNIFDSVYESGYTITGKIKDKKVEVNLLLVPEENSMVESLRPGDEILLPVRVLDFDSFYQRAILGSILKDNDTQENLVHIIKNKETDLTPQKENFQLSGELLDKQNTAEENIITDKISLTSGTPAKGDNEWGKSKKNRLNPNEKRINSKLVFLALGAITSALFATWGWGGGSYPFLRSDSAHWIFWALLTYPLAIGLPCIACRAWKSFFITICAFGFDVFGTSLTYKQNENLAVEAEQKSVEQTKNEPFEVEAPNVENLEVIGEEIPSEKISTSEMEEEAVSQNALIGGRYYDIALVLQTLGILGLAISTLSFGKEVLGILFACVYLWGTFTTILRGEIWFLEDPLFNQSNLLLLPIIACCYSIIVGVKNQTERKS
jgi:hypothetical protein